jgi:hypothetical protein
MTLGTTAEVTTRSRLTISRALSARPICIWQARDDAGRFEDHDVAGSEARRDRVRRRIDVVEVRRPVTV